MSVKQVLRFTLRMAISAGVNEILGNVIQTTTPIDITPIRKTFVKIGKIALTDVIGGLIADLVIKEVEEIYSELATPVIPPKPEEKKDPTPTKFPVGSALNISRSLNDISPLTDNFNAPAE